MGSGASSENGISGHRRGPSYRVEVENVERCWTKNLDFIGKMQFHAGYVNRWEQTSISFSFTWIEIC